MVKLEELKSILYGIAAGVIANIIFEMLKEKSSPRAGKHMKRD